MLRLLRQGQKLAQSVNLVMPPLAQQTQAQVGSYFQQSDYFSNFTNHNGVPIKVINEGGSKRVVVTKELPGDAWLKILQNANCRVEICQAPEPIVDNTTIEKLIGSKCDGVLGQLTEDWGEQLFNALKSAGGTAYSNYAVGFNNVDVKAATKHKIAVGNTPGVLTETTAELALALTFACARRIVEADRFMRTGQYKGWLPTLFIGNLLQEKTVGVIGAGRIGAAYARMLVEGHKMNLIYYDPFPNKKLEEYLANYSKLLEQHGEKPIKVERKETMEEVLQQADVVSLHCNLDENSKHLINKERLSNMKPNAILINASRGPIHYEKDLVDHLKANPDFYTGLDVFEDEPNMYPGLESCDNAVIVPHIASASMWTRSGMATLAAANVAKRLNDKPVYGKPDVLPYVNGDPNDIPDASPNIVNGKELGLPYL